MILRLIKDKNEIFSEINNFNFFFIKENQTFYEIFLNKTTNEFNLLIFLFILATIIALIVFFISYLLVFQTPYLEKISAYECGFLPFQDARLNFDVRFYLVAILFIIFDLEISFLFPWSVSLIKMGIVGFYSMILFLIILTLGFIFEWQKGALDWT